MSDELRRLQDELARAVAGLDARQTQATPLTQVGKWSIEQVVEHLLMSYRTSVEVISTRVEKGRPTLAKPSLGQRLGQFVLIKLGRFPAGRKAPAAVDPPQPVMPASGEELAARVRAELVRLDEVTARGERLFGGRRAASHLALGPLSMQQWRRFHLVHGRHHLGQILAIRREQKC